MEPKDNEPLQFEFLPLTLSIQTLGGMSTPVIRRGTPLPAKRSQIFSTAEDNQKSVEIVLYLGERPLAKNNMRIGSCLLQNIPPAPRGQPEIRVTFKVDTFCKVKVEAVKLKSTRKIEARTEQTVPNLTSDLIERLLKAAEENLGDDQARSAMTSAELRVRKDQERNLVTATTRKLEELIAEMGLALMERNKALMISRTKELEKLLAKPTQTPSPFGFGGFDSIFNSFYQPKSTRPLTYRREAVRPREQKPMTSSLATVPTHTTTLVQRFLESIEPELELKRAAAWEAVESNRPDARAQASHSMREILRQLLDRLAPTEEVQKAPWYEKPKSGAPVTRAMRVRYALAGTSEVTSKSTLSLVTDLTAAVDSMYAKLSAESHSDKRVPVTATMVYLSACEAVIGLIASQRQG